jgi:biotin transport system substrate-specific component
VGVAIIYVLGLGWLANLIGAEKAVTAGLLPFIPAEVLKVALGTAILTAAWKQAKR